MLSHLFINFTVSIHSSCLSNSFYTRCNLHLRFWVARLTKKNGIQPYLQQREFVEWKCFLPFPLSFPPSDIFLLFRNRIFSPPLSLSLLLSSLVFFTLARFLRAPLPRELALRAILRTFVISRNRGVLVKSSVSILENVKKRWVESRGCGFPPHFHANSVKTPILNPEERTKLPLRFTSTCSDLLLCLSYSISSIVPWQSSAGIIRRIGF